MPTDKNDHRLLDLLILTEPHIDVLRTQWGTFWKKETCVWGVCPFWRVYPTKMHDYGFVSKYGGLTNCARTVSYTKSRSLAQQGFQLSQASCKRRPLRLQ